MTFTFDSDVPFEVPVPVSSAADEAARERQGKLEEASLFVQSLARVLGEQGVEVKDVKQAGLLARVDGKHYMVGVQRCD